MDGTADLTLTSLLAQFCSTSLLRLAGEWSTVQLLADPVLYWDISYKLSRPTLTHTTPAHPTIQIERCPYVCKSQPWGWLAPYHSVAHVYED